MSFTFLSSTFSQKFKTIGLDSSMLNNKIEFIFNPSFAFANYTGFSNVQNRNIREFVGSINLKAGYFVLRNFSVGVEFTYGKYFNNYDDYRPTIKRKGFYINYFPTNWRVYNFSKYTTKKKKKIFAHPMVSMGVSTSNNYIGIYTANNLRYRFENNRNDNLAYQFLLGIQVNIVKKLNLQILRGFTVQNPVQNLLPNTTLLKTNPIGQVSLLLYINKKRK
jgi:hypothetical protein